MFHRTMRNVTLAMIAAIGLNLICMTQANSQSAQEKPPTAKSADAAGKRDSMRLSGKNLTYTKDIAPIVAQSCLPCHLAENENPSRLSLDNYETLMKGGENGTSITPGRPEESSFYSKLLPKPPFGKQMPKRKKPLSEEEMKRIYDWITQGAKK